MNKFFVWLTGKLAPLWTRLGADPRALQLILEVKLKMGDRTPNFMARNQKKSADYSWLIYLAMFGFGFLMVALYFLMDDQATALGIAFSAVIIYLGFILIAEMSENIFDVRDLTILLSRPINDVTFSLSRALYIFSYVAKFGGLVFLPLGLALIYFKPLALPVYILLSLACLTITVTVTMGIYLTLLRSVPAERFRQILGYFQIVASVIFFLAYQGLNLINIFGDEMKSSLKSDTPIDIVGTVWGFIWPGFWLGGVWEVATTFSGNAYTIVQAVLGVGLTVAGVLYYVSQSKGYGENLIALQLGGTGAPASPPGPGEAITKGNTWGKRLANRLTRPGLERATFLFTWAIMLRDVKFKQQVYPSLVIMPVFVLGILVAGFLKFGEGEGIGQGTMVFALYFFVLTVVGPLSQTRISDDFRAGWVFQATPAAATGAIGYGQLMAVFAQFCLPQMIFIYPIILLYAGIGFLPDIILSAAVLTICCVIYQLTEETLPFTQERKVGGFSAIGPLILLSIVASLAGLVHWAISFLPYVTWVAAVGAWLLVPVFFRMLRRRVVKR